MSLFSDWGIEEVTKVKDMTELMKAGRQVRRLKQAISLIKNCQKETGVNSLDKILKSLDKELIKFKEEQDKLR